MAKNPLSRSPAELISTYGIISDQISKKEVEIILRELLSAIDHPGAIVEFGCYIGTTSLYIQRVLCEQSDRREFHVYDSFAGLPDKSAADASPVGEQFTTGELAVSKKEFIAQFKKADLPLPRIHKGWFCDMNEDDIPSSIAFAFLDGDYYDSITDSLQLVWPRLTKGACIIVDDYMNEALPGAQKAVDEWLT